MLSLFILLLLLSYISLIVCSSIGSSKSSIANSKSSIANSKRSNSKSSIAIVNDSIKDNNDISLSKYDKSLSKVLIVILPLLYFISVSLNHISLPKVVNKSINGVSSVSHQSASTYGILSGIDAAFTFLSVNLIGI